MATTLPSATPSKARAAPSPALFAILLTFVIVCCSVAARLAEGQFSQIPISESALAHRDAMHILRSTQDRGLRGLHDSFVHASAVNAPLLTAASAFVMFIFGPSRVAAESVFVLFIFIFIYSSAYILQKIFDPAQSKFAVLLACTFPVLLNACRNYSYDLPFAAMAALAGASVAFAGDFSRAPRALFVGLSAGLLLLTKTGGALLLIGPALVYFILNARRGMALRSMIHILIAAAIALVIAGAWYIPNAAAVLDRFLAIQETWNSAPAAWLALSLVLEGPGVPILSIAALAALIQIIRARGAPKIQKETLAVAAGVLSVIFTIILLQRAIGGVLYLCILPFAAILLLRAVAGLRYTLIRWAVGAVIILLASWSAAESTFFFPRAGAAGGMGNFILDIPLWNRRSFYFNSASGAERPFVNYRIRETLIALDELHLRFEARIVVASDHPFFNAAVFQYDAIRSRRPWGFEQTAPIANQPADPDRYLSQARQLCIEADALIWKYSKNQDPVTRVLAPAIDPLVDGEKAIFTSAREPILLDDGSEIRIFNKK